MSNVKLSAEPFADIAHISKVTTMADGSPRIYVDFMEHVPLGVFDPFRKKEDQIVVMIMRKEDYNRMVGKPEVKFDTE